MLPAAIPIGVICAGVPEPGTFWLPGLVVIGAAVWRARPPAPARGSGYANRLARTWAERPDKAGRPRPLPSGTKRQREVCGPRLPVARRRGDCGRATIYRIRMSSSLSPEEIRAAAETHNELGPAYRDAVIDSFLDKVGREIDARVDARLAQQQAAQPPARDRRGHSGSPMALAIISMALGIRSARLLSQLVRTRRGSWACWWSGSRSRLSISLTTSATRRGGVGRQTAAEPPGVPGLGPADAERR
jgi:hypothetical protein